MSTTARLIMDGFGINPETSGNAIYAATGARVTRIPATPDKVLAALKEL